MSRIVWAGDYANPETDGTENNLYMIAHNNYNEMIQCPESQDTSNYRYIVNHSKKLYVDKERCLQNNYYIIHPLPLLVSEGNGQGGGDYYGNNIELCGTWARDSISVEKSINNDYNELVCDFRE